MEYITRKLSGTAPHSAFTDLCAWQGFLYCCFREALNHVSANGRIKILKLDAQGNVLKTSIVQIARSDLRDPKLTVHPNGCLCLLVWNKRFNASGQYIASKAVSLFSSDGLSWSSPKEIGDAGWWLWRVRWHKKNFNTSNRYTEFAYGFGYNRSANAIHLYQGDPLRHMQIHKKNVLCKEKHGLGYPNESDLLFIGDDAWAIVRRDADSYSAQLGHATWPFKQWTWHDIETYIGGPCMLQKNQTHIYVAGRIWENQKLTTRLLELDVRTMELKTVADLPSSGDNSYPGLAKLNNTLFISYYSSHKDNKSQIYLASF